MQHQLESRQLVGSLTSCRGPVTSCQAAKLLLPCAKLLSCKAVVLLLATLSTGASAQSRLASGHVIRPAKEGPPTPVAGQWIVLHRVGSDTAAPIDSVRSDRDGRFRFRYKPFGATDALYFVSARHAGITYFSPPLRGANVSGGDADVIVYDTTSDTTALSMTGRHIVVSAPRGGRREIAEIFEMDNSGSMTVVARDSAHPVWSVTLPEQAESASVARGDVSEGAVAFRSNRADVFAPISPGIRQLVVTYRLPADAFPLSQLIGRSVAILEVLVEEPRARVEGARLREVDAAAIEGRMFRRFIGQAAPANSVVRIDAPAPVERNRSAMKILAGIVAGLMLVAAALWLARRGRSAPGGVRVSTRDALIAELASLDSRFEKSSGDASARADYERERAALKERLARELASAQRQS